MTAIADTSPLNYLILIDHVDVLAHIYKRVVIPRAVFEELNAHAAPDPVRRWLQQKPTWLDIIDQPITSDPSLDYLGRGERDAILLAPIVNADRFIVDESAARTEALRRGIPVIGLLGLLLEASRRGLLHLPQAVEALLATSFYVSEELIERLLDLDKHKLR